MAKEGLMDHAESDVDFYDLLGVTFETSESDIRRAYRKTALKYHPDKLGKDFDPEKFHLLQIANDVLSDPSAKAKYNHARNAKLQRKRQIELFEGKRRQMKEDLEARERGGVASSSTGAKRPREEDVIERMLRELADKGKRRREEQEREKMKAQSSSPSIIPEAVTINNSALEKNPETVAEEAEEEDKVAELERQISEMKAEKARKKAEKRARKSGIFARGESPVADKRATASTTPMKHSDVSKELKADEKPPASPKFSFSPSMSSSGNGGFASTMKRLKEQQMLADEIRKQEAVAK